MYDVIVVGAGHAGCEAALAAARLGLDKNGKEIIPLTYEAAEDFNDGRARVKKDGEWFYIDYNGNRIE